MGVTLWNTEMSILAIKEIHDFKQPWGNKCKNMLEDFPFVM